MSSHEQEKQRVFISSSEVKRLENRDQVSDQSERWSAPLLRTASPGKIIREKEPYTIDSANTLAAGVRTVVNSIRSEGKPPKGAKNRASLAVENVQVSCEPVGYIQRLAGLETALLNTMEQYARTSGARAHAPYNPPHADVDICHNNGSCYANHNIGDNALAVKPSFRSAVKDAVQSVICSEEIASAMPSSIAIASAYVTALGGGYDRSGLGNIRSIYQTHARLNRLFNKRRHP